MVAFRVCAAVVLLGWPAGCGEDLDGDGYPPGVDCDDLDPAVHPGAAEYFDGKDNDCDGVADLSSDYRWFVEAEPNDTLLEDCYDGAGQYLGTLAPLGMVSTIDGRIDTVVPLDYDLGDRDCLAFRLPEAAVLHATITWPEAETDLDFAVWSTWGEDETQETFLGSTDVDHLMTSSSSDGALSPDYRLYLWLTAYDGVPTTYRITLWTSAEAGGDDG